MYKKVIRTSIILLVVAAIGFVFLSEISKLDRLKKQNEVLTERIDTVSKQNEDYKDKIRAMKTDIRYVEKVIREELGMIKEGEKVYKFEGN